MSTQSQHHLKALGCTEDLDVAASSQRGSMSRTVAEIFEARPGGMLLLGTASGPAVLVGKMSVCTCTAKCANKGLLGHDCNRCCG